MTEKQLITIFGHQERTALSVEDIWASWPDIYPGTEPSESLEVLSKSHAFRLVAWLKKQPDAPVVEVEVEVPCTCDAVAFAMVDAETEPSAEAQAMWATALEALAEELPRTTFDTWLEATEGVLCEGEILLVKVPKPMPRWDVHFGELEDDRKDSIAPNITFRPQLGGHR